ncbi:MAG: FkbM family methyltransferase [Puniceicoccaceae bacterium]
MDKYQSNRSYLNSVIRVTADECFVCDGTTKYYLDDPCIGEELGGLDKISISFSYFPYNEENFEHTYNEFFPSMPMIFGAFTFYDVDSKIKVLGLQEKGSVELFSWENRADWTKVELQCEKSSVKCHVNGVLLGKVAYCYESNWRSMIFVGCGFLKRYWCGVIEELCFSRSDPKIATTIYPSSFRAEKSSGFEVLNRVTLKDGLPKERNSISDTQRLQDDMRYYSSKETQQDRWVIDMLKGKREGFFVDLGASDGKSANNTLTLESYFDWNGILIEGNRNSFILLCKNRRNQVCCNEIVSSKEGMVNWRENDEIETRSGVDESLPDDNEDKSWRIGKIVSKKSTTLQKILDENNAPKVIDYLSIDIEGGEVEAMRDFPFSEYQFSVISAEVGFKNRSEFDLIMKANGYFLVENPYSSVKYERFYVSSAYLPLC